MRDPVYYFIGNLALCDICLLLLYWPIQLVKFALSWPFGTILCYISNSFPILFSAQAALTIIWMAFDRYHVAINSAKSNSSCWRNISKLGVIFILALALACPDIAFTSEDKTSALMLGSSKFKVNAKCWIEYGSHNYSTSAPWQIYFLLRYNILCVIPLSIVILMYKLSTFKTGELLPTKDNTTIGYNIEEDRKLIKLPSILIVIYFLSLTPEHIYYYVMINSPSFFNIQTHAINSFLFLICQLLLISRSAVNPFIYSASIPECRQVMIAMYGWDYKPKCLYFGIKNRNDQIVEPCTKLKLTHLANKVEESPAKADLHLEINLVSTI
ncbi:Neuropeptide FF receptor 2 [Trichoplax sp. H2]|nr:Neuropeptide FF receptor 2 [Trichoplax sp. H2]|eukprot:RDD37914.1 Neuropeptide FF receptor 2 [Trichoplax sp. H2]